MNKTSSIINKETIIDQSQYSYEMSETDTKILAEYNKILSEKFNIEGLKNEQYYIIKNIVKKKDVLALLATGFGKSVCYQLPFFIMKKTIIVVSPLIALAEDQKNILDKLKIPACCFNSTNMNKKGDKDDIANGNNKIIFITPEYMAQCEDFLKKMKDNIGLICIDEAHCVSMWSDFRESYTKLDVIRKWVPEIPILALTATATNQVKKDIIDMLKLNSPRIVKSSFDRPNLYISIKKKDKKYLNDIMDHVIENDGNYMLIYCKTKKLCDEVFLNFKKNDIGCCLYHGSLTPEQRIISQQSFMSGETKIMIATLAFGLGINMNNIRMIIHIGCPKNIEAYYQEIGRAQRNGEKGYCYMYFSYADFKINEKFATDITNIVLRNYKLQEIKETRNYVNTKFCRRKFILDYFGEKYNKFSCENCDNCLNRIVYKNLQQDDDLAEAENEIDDFMKKKL